MFALECPRFLGRPGTFSWCSPCRDALGEIAVIRKQSILLDDKSLPDKSRTRTHIDEIYRERYANNIYFEHSAWDLKLIFGHLDQREGKVVIRQNTAITLPWTQIKLLSDWLRGHLETYELANGKVRIPSNAIPSELAPPTPEQRKSDPNRSPAGPCSPSYLAAFALLHDGCGTC
jgi:Protein of unknown function (DUF3467)